MNRPDFCAKLLTQLGERRGAPPLPRHRARHGAGHPEGRRLARLREGRGPPRLDPAGHRAGQPRRLGRLRPRPARVRPQGHRDLRDDDGRRRRLRARGHRPRGHLRRPGPPSHARRRPHVQPATRARGCTASARSSSPGASGGSPRPRRARLGLRGPQPALGPVAAQAHRRGLQRLVHVPDPASGARRDRPVAAAVHQVGRLRVRPARQGGRLPHGDVPRGRGLARPVDRQERRAGLAGLLPPAQPASSRRCCTRRTTKRRPDGPGEPSTTRSSTCVSMQYSTVELRHQALEDVLAGPDHLHRDLPTKLAEVNAFRKQFTDARLEADPDAFPPVRRKKPPRKGRDDTEIPGRLSPAGHRGPGRRSASSGRARDALARVPRGGDHGDGRQVVPADALRLGRRLHERRHLGRALPARPREVPRAHPQDDRDPRAAAPGVAATGRGVPRELAEITSPEAWDETFRPWTDGSSAASAEDTR